MLLWIQLLRMQSFSPHAVSVVSQEVILVALSPRCWRRRALSCHHFLPQYCKELVSAHDLETIHVRRQKSVVVLTFFDNLKILILALDNLLEIAEVLAQIVYFASVELDSIRGGLFDVEACANIDDDGAAGCEVAGHVEGLG
jgi:hypothetical protein